MCPATHLWKDIISRKGVLGLYLNRLQKKTKVIAKGKHASSTENRRMVWEKIIWPLVLDVNRSYFSLKEYHVKRDQFCQTYKIRPSKVACGVVSLLVKGILVREKKGGGENTYSIHY